MIALLVVRAMGIAGDVLRLAASRLEAVGGEEDERGRLATGAGVAVLEVTGWLAGGFFAAEGAGLGSLRLRDAVVALFFGFVVSLFFFVFVFFGEGPREEEAAAELLATAGGLGE